MAVVAACLASAAGAILLSRLVFPYLSIDNDEAINRLYAETLAHGHLFPPTLGLPLAFRPWLAAVVGGHYVLKYTPVVPAMAAASSLLTGGTALYLAALAAATVAMTYLLARQVLGDRAEAATAAVLMAASPLVVVQSGLILSYLPTLLFLETFAWALVRGLSRGPNLLLGLSGAALGLAFFARTFDAVVFALPLLVWALLVLWGRRGGPAAQEPPRSRVAPAVWFGVPAAAVLGVFLGFNAAATGSPTRLPFSLLERSDTLGFGPRRMYPTDRAHYFGLGKGISGVLRHGALLNFWVAGGSLLLVVAGATVVRRRVQGVSWALVAAGLLLPVSYVFFWGPWNATVIWGGTRWVGPFYFLPVLVPVTLFGGRGLVDLCRHRRRLGVAAAVAMAAVTTVTLAVLVAGNLGFTRQNRALAGLVKGHAPRQLVFATTETPFLMHPTAVVANRWDVSGPVVYAVERGDPDLDAVHLMPDRTPYRLTVATTFRNPRSELRARLEEMALLRADHVDLEVVVRRPARRAGAALPPGPLSLTVSSGGVTRLYSLGAGDRYDLNLAVDGTGARLVGGQPVWERPDPTPSGLSIALVASTPGSSPPTTVARERLALRRSGATVELLVPAGPVWTAGRGGPPALELRLR